MIPLPDDPKMLAYVKQVAAEMGVDDLTAWQMIQGGEGGASPTPEQSGIVPDDATPLPAATAPGRRNRPAEVAQSPTRMVQPMPSFTQPQSTQASILEELRKMMQPKQTVAGAVTDALGWTTPGDPNRPSNLLSLALKKSGLTGEKKNIAERTEAAEKENPYSITPTTVKKTPQLTLANLLFHRDAAPTTVPTKKPQQQQQAGLFSFLRGLG